jgi:hypothetical protein
MKSLKVRFDDNGYLGKTVPEDGLYKAIAQTLEENKRRVVRAMLICNDFRSTVSWSDFP